MGHRSDKVLSGCRGQDGGSMETRQARQWGSLVRDLEYKTHTLNP